MSVKVETVKQVTITLNEQQASLLRTMLSRHVTLRLLHQIFDFDSWAAMSDAVPHSEQGLRVVNGLLDTEV